MLDNKLKQALPKNPFSCYRKEQDSLDVCVQCRGELNTELLAHCMTFKISIMIPKSAINCV